MALWTKTAAQLSQMRTDYLKDLAMHGEDIVMVTTLRKGTWDPVKDRMVDGEVVQSDTAYAKSILLIPVKHDAGDGKGRYSVVLGHKLEGYDAGSMVVGKLSTKVPLSPTATYVIHGISYKFVKILESVAVTPTVPVYNLVQFANG